MRKRYLWSSKELSLAFSQNKTLAGVEGISIDSRTTKEGDLFIALSGNREKRRGEVLTSARDGHAYIGMAEEAGASVVMSHREIAYSVPTLKVEDTLQGLWDLGRASRRRMKGKVAAITGSSGKTTLRNWLQTIITKMSRCHASEGSLNNHWGVPLSLARMPANSEIGLFEIGTNHPGEIEPLSRLVEPDVAIVLNVLPAHIGNFSGMTELENEKFSIKHGLRTGGVLVAPEAFARSKGSSSVLTFGERGDVSAVSRRTSAGTSMVVNVHGRTLECEVPFVGKERMESITAMFAVLSALGCDVAKSIDHIGALELPKGRGNLLERGGMTIIDDSYNANPSSMKMSLTYLDSMRRHKRRIALLGEMLELGKASAVSHQHIGNYLNNVDEVYTFGTSFQNVSFERKRHYQSVDEFDIPSFVEQLKPRDCILIKGSNKVFWKEDFVSQLILEIESSN
jgi:UDP-N-acetylmuramoyl-tripeptide--D-alanyl-D-alanine ligase